MDDARLVIARERGTIDGSGVAAPHQE